MSEPAWIKSSYSSNNSDNCVEVRLGSVVGVRDSKDRRGPQLAVRPATWTSFLTALRADRFSS